MGIFDEPKRLAKLLASLNTHSTNRPLRPVETALWLQEGVRELGNKEEVMKRVNIKQSMWTGFEKLLKISPEYRDQICWGKSNKEKMEIGFSTAHYLVEGLDENEQRILLDSMWDPNIDRPYAVDELKQIKSYYKSKPEIGMEKAISDILKVNRPLKKEIIFIFISGLKKDMYENLKQMSETVGASLDEYVKNIFLQSLGANTVINTRVKPDVIRIAFSGKGEIAFKKMTAAGNVNKNNIVEHILEIGVMA